MTVGNFYLTLDFYLIVVYNYIIFELFEDAKEISFEYDNGRLIVYVGDNVFYQNLGVGNDFSISIKLGKE